MLETAPLDARLSKRDYKRRMPVLQRRLHHLQRACHEADLGNVIVFEGWYSSGVSTTIRKLSERLEPRALEMTYTVEPRTHELPMPWLYRFWKRLPNWGQMAIFDRSWYWATLMDRGSGALTDAEWAERQRNINTFEHALADDRYRVVKFYFHISPEEQEQRYDRLSADPLTAWMVTDEDRERLANRPRYAAMVEEMLAMTETEWGPWTIVAATNKRWRRVRVFEVLIEQLEASLRSHGFDAPEYMEEDPLEDWESEDTP
jgi:polyphosphate kinase 2 (PPK2 family)